jgi:hypothetical protein
VSGSKLNVPIAKDAYIRNCRTCPLGLSYFCARTVRTIIDLRGACDLRPAAWCGAISLGHGEQAGTVRQQVVIASTIGELESVPSVYTLMTQLYHVIIDGWPMTSEDGTTHLALFYWAIERHGSGGDTNSDFRPQHSSQVGHRRVSLW